MSAIQTLFFTSRTGLPQVLALPDACCCDVLMFDCYDIALSESSVGDRFQQLSWMVHDYSEEAYALRCDRKLRTLGNDSKTLRPGTSLTHGSDPGRGCQIESKAVASLLAR